MTEELKIYIEEVLTTFEREKKFLKENDWTTDKEYKSKRAFYDLHYTLVSKHLNSADKIYKMSGNDLSEPEVKKAIVKLVATFDLFDKNVDSYLKKNDWTYDVDEIDKVGHEVSFQSSISKNRSELKLIRSAIPTSEDKQKVYIPTLDNTLVPFPMKRIIENKFPDIAVAYQDKMNAPQKGRKAKK